MKLIVIYILEDENGVGCFGCYSVPLGKLIFEVVGWTRQVLKTHLGVWDTARLM